MPFRATDRISGTRDGVTSDYLINPTLPATKLDREYLDELVRQCAIVGLDTGGMAIQCMHETANMTSPRWVKDHNPAGIAIVSNSTDQPFVIRDGKEAATLHVQCVYSMLHGRLAAGLPELNSGLKKWMADVWLPKVTSSHFPPVATWSDCGKRYVDVDGRPRAVWAWESGDQLMYGRKLERRGIELYPSMQPQKEKPVADIVFGRVARPDMTILIVSKPVHTSSGYGYDYVPGGRKPVGMVHHETQGRGSGAFYHAFFSCPSGQRCRNALVDFFIDRAGKIFMLNDPFGNRAGWANGGGVGEPGGLEGDGPAFYAKFGSYGINTRLVSIEYESTNAENFTDAQIQSGGRLAAWIHDLDGQRWDQHPFTSKYGCVTSFLHFEFGTTDCGKGELDDITKIQAVTKGVMKAAQIGGGDVPVEPDVPPLPDPPLPGGISVAEAKKRFGKLHRQSNNRDYGFDPNGPISLAWAYECAANNEWPSADQWIEFKDDDETVHILTFSNHWLIGRQSARDSWKRVTFQTIPTD